MNKFEEKRQFLAVFHKILETLERGSQPTDIMELKKPYFWPECAHALRLKVSRRFSTSEVINRFVVPFVMITDRCLQKLLQVREEIPVNNFLDSCV